MRATLGSYPEPSKTNDGYTWNGTSSIAYSPEASVTSERPPAVFSPAIATVSPSIGSPVTESVTVPEIEPHACTAQSGGSSKSSTTSTSSPLIDDA